MGGEMGVGQTTRGHDSRPSGGCKAGVPQGTMQTFSTHPLTQIHSLPASTLLCPGRLTTWTAQMGTPALSLGVENQREALQEMQEGRKVRWDYSPGSLPGWLPWDDCIPPPSSRLPSGSPLTTAPGSTLSQALAMLPLVVFSLLLTALYIISLLSFPQITWLDCVLCSPPRPELMQSCSKEIRRWLGKALEANAEREMPVGEGGDWGMEGHDDREEWVIGEVECQTSHRLQHLCENCRVPGTMPQALTKLT